MAGLNVLTAIVIYYENSIQAAARLTWSPRCSSWRTARRVYCGASWFHPHFHLLMWPLQGHGNSWNSAHLGEAARQRQHAGLTVEPEILAHILLTSEYRWPKRR